MDKNVLEREKLGSKDSSQKLEIVDHMSTLRKNKSVRVIKNYLKRKYELELVGETSLDLVAVNDVFLTCCVQKSFRNVQVKTLFFAAF